KSLAFPNAPDTPAAIAVDDSTSASDQSAGDLYVLDATHSKIDKFKADGTYLNQIALNGEALGVGVDAGGRVYVSFPEVDPKTIEVFDNSTTNGFVRSMELPGKNGAILEGAQYAQATSPSGDQY